MSANYDEVIANLKNVKTVREWNDVRDRAKRFLSLKEINSIDQSGLIVDVLGEDGRRPVYDYE